jgi:hypothetical protein
VCRKHRIDLATLVQQGAAFDVLAFVAQVHEPDYLNLFLTSLGCISFSLRPTLEPAVLTSLHDR